MGLRDKTDGLRDLLVPNITLSGPADVATQLQGLMADLYRYPAAFDGSAAAVLGKLLDRSKAARSLSRAEQEQLLNEARAFCLEHRLHHLLAVNRVPHPAYNFHDDLQLNEAGPWDAVPDFAIETPLAWRLFGMPVRFPLGVGACVMTQNARWVHYWSRWGFNVLTFKTVRSKAHPGHRFPHWKFLRDADEPWIVDPGKEIFAAARSWPVNIKAFSTANSFGVPCPEPDVWQQEYAEAQSQLLDGQLLLLSVMGTGATEDEVVQDFVDAARLGVEAGAQVLELNLSCPNNAARHTRGDMEEPYCLNTDLSVDIVRRVAQRFDVPLVPKLSYRQPEGLRALVRGLLEVDNVVGISGINTEQMPIRHVDSDEAAFQGTSEDPKAPREKAGVSGIAIRTRAEEFLENVARVRESSGRAFDIIALGGIMTGEHAASAFQKGADCVQSVTAAAVNSRLALEAFATYVDRLREQVARSLADERDPMDRYSVALAADMTPEEATIALHAMTVDDQVYAQAEGDVLHFVIRRSA